MSTETEPTPDYGPFPTACRWLLYKLTAEDAEAVNARRHNANKSMATVVHVGNDHHVGEHLPMLVVRTWEHDQSFNGQVFLDGNDSLWKTSIKLGDVPGTAHWPPRV